VRPAIGRDYHDAVGLTLVVGPAHAGKVALLLERTLERLDLDPWLIVPNRFDVERTERELVARVESVGVGVARRIAGIARVDVVIRLRRG